MKALAATLLGILITSQAATALADQGFAKAGKNGNYIKWGHLIYWADGTQCHHILGRIECARNDFRPDHINPIAWKNRLSKRIAVSDGKICTDFRNSIRCRTIDNEA
jgi:hypothetical protein